MARSPLNLDSRQISDTTLTTLYTAPAATVASGLSLVITNVSASSTGYSVYFNDGITNFLLASRTVAGGTGKTWIVPEVSGLKLNAGDSIRVQSNSANTYNTNLSGTEVT